MRTVKKRKYVKKSPVEQEISRLLKEMPPKRAKRKIVALVNVLFK